MGQKSGPQRARPESGLTRAHCSPVRQPGEKSGVGVLPSRRSRVTTQTGLSPGRAGAGGGEAMAAAGRWRYAMVCSSNMNRSMEAHSLLGRAGLEVASYGTGAQVKLPGPSIHEPNVYGFGTPYKAIHDDLRRKDTDLYKRNGLLPMLKRNSTVKTAPQRWQENAGDGPFDVVFTFEEKVFDLVVEDLNSREQRLIQTVLIINMDVKDNHEEAGVGAQLALDLCQKLEAVDGWEDTIDDIITAFEKQYKRKMMYSISFY